MPVGHDARENADERAVFKECRDGKRVAVAAQGDGRAEQVSCLGVRSLYIGLLAPGGGTSEDIDGAGAVRTVAGSRFAHGACGDTGEGAVLLDCSNGKGIAIGAQGEGISKAVTCAGVRCLHIRLLSPGRTT